MRLFDTMTREIREISPRDGETYRYYCCGPTVYGPAHIGNFRTFVLQDVFRRTLELSGVPTYHVRNLTDVDDKTIRDSRAAGKSLKEFTEIWTARFHDDCARLNLLPPHTEPSAIGHVDHQIAMIEELVEKGHAYRSDDGSVYYKVTSFEGYGRLSRLDQRELRDGASGAVSDDEYEKDSVADFALWKARREEDGENFWESPWGQGRPGWHLECSAMSREYLGDSFDLHSGGVDLIFPHHENEIAQSEACTGKSMADHWFHLTHLLVDSGKMSKSAGNFYTLDQLADAGFSPAELRYVLISANYSQPLNFVAKDKDGSESFPALLGARQALQRIAKFDEALTAPVTGQQGGAQQGKGTDLTLLRQGFSGQAGLDEARKVEDRGSFQPAFEALLNDLNTPDTLGRIFSAIKSIDVSALSPEEATKERSGLRFVLAALGLELPGLESASVDIPSEIAELGEKRWAAKNAKDWDVADKLRDELAASGWEIKDTKEGYELCPKS